MRVLVSATCLKGFGTPAVFEERARFCRKLLFSALNDHAAAHASLENEMFGYRGGEPADLLRRKVLERQSAMSKWPFLTTLDLSTIHSEQQLASIVKDRTGSKVESVTPSVHAWMDGYNQRLAAAPANAEQTGKVYELRPSRNKRNG